MPDPARLCRGSRFPAEVTAHAVRRSPRFARRPRDVEEPLAERGVVVGDETGMTFAFEPYCAFGRRAVHIGGTVIVGDDEAIALNPSTARIPRAGTR